MNTWIKVLCLFIAFSTFACADSPTPVVTCDDVTECNLEIVHQDSDSYGVWSCDHPDDDVRECAWSYECDRAVCAKQEKLCIVECDEKDCLLGDTYPLTIICR